MTSLMLTDGYKLNHHSMYPKGTTKVYSNFTPRSNKFFPKSDKVLVVGTTAVFDFINEEFKANFFSQDKDKVCKELKEEFSLYCGFDYDVSHFEALHDLGHLPLQVKALPEGTLCPIKVPILTITNTHPDYYWLVNYLETLISCMLWQPLTSATIAFEYRKILEGWAKKTDENNLGFVSFQAHDFSMRGMSSVQSSIMSGLAHSMVFNGSDNIPSLFALRKYYNAEGFVIGGVPATEHSIMCAGGKETEIETFRYLMQQFPKGILSIVSDTWNLWDVLTKYLPELKEEILTRDGKIVIRPDSGDPVDIICGVSPFRSDIHPDQPERKGVIELLWDTFGGTINEQGYKVLDPHIGAIYGDSITLERAEQICQRLETKGFASTNIVLGVGSFTYQYNTRDTFGFAMKATYVEIDGKGVEIFKDPITDSGTKKSAKGLLQVNKVNGELVLTDQVDYHQEQDSELKTIYLNGVVFKDNYQDIKNRINNLLLI